MSSAPHFSWRQRVAGLFSIGFAGHSLSDELRAALRDGVGGVVLFRRNIRCKEQVAELICDIKAYADRPVLVSVDQEGGLVQRLKTGFTCFPPAAVIGSTQSAEVAYEVGSVLGSELRAIGVDLNFAPVLDVNTNASNPVIGRRALSHDPHLVAQLGIALGQGIEGAGVASCGKHFPGHGDTESDSHLDLPRQRHRLERLRRVELVPFHAWARAGLASLMTAHVIFEALDAKWPATLSKAITTELLRGQCAFDGLVFSDDMEMKAIADHFGHEQAALLGLGAGIDHFLCCQPTDLADRMIAALSREAEKDPALAEKIAQAETRNHHFRHRWARGPQAARWDLLQSKKACQLAERLAKLELETTLTNGSDPTEIINNDR